ncbi:MAG: DNA mismatch repair protein MutS [Acidobacteriota bacterium]
MPASSQLTPMLRHYLEVKAEHPDCLLFYRMGDFYELFFDDAVEGAPLLEVTLTARHKGGKNEVPMCGVPHHAVDSYIGKVLRLGRKVAICEQVEDPAKAKGLVKREVTRIVTPGTISEPELLDGKEENLLACVVWQPVARPARRGRQADAAADAAPGAGAFLDVSTGAFFVRRWRDVERCVEDLGVLRPREVLIDGDDVPEAARRWVEAEVVCWAALDDDQRLDDRRAHALLCEQLDAAGTLAGYGLDAGEPAVRAAAQVLAYAQETQRADLLHVRQLTVRDVGSTAIVDATTLSNLEIFRNQREGTRDATLLQTIDRTVTAPGGRRLRDWLRRPLKVPAALALRHDAVAALVADAVRRIDVRTALAGVGDPERLLSRAVFGQLTPREAATLRDTLARVPTLLATLAAVENAPRLAALAAVDPCVALADELARVLQPEPSAKLDDGDVIADGVDPELDRSRSLARDSKRHILALEAREREATGITSLKVRYNKVFGYYLEVTKANQHRVPDHYIRKQTLVNAERYITPEVKELEEQILSAEGRQLALEREYFEQLRARVADEGAGLHALADALAEIDVLAALAEVAVARRYVRPAIDAPGAPIRIAEGRHPVVEATGRTPEGEAFIPNDVALDDDQQVIVLTGPNMGGKSTYLRQVALIVLLAQIGSFVPATSASIGCVDRVFTRVGASDDLARGASTFMVEMVETANILRHATGHSLVILDEVGRGTATFDGLSLAWAIVEHLHNGPQRPKTLFATHYHELTALAGRLPAVVNRTLAVKEWQDRIVFLRRVVPGSANKSYGIHVARLAGLPDAVVARAEGVLAQLEADGVAPSIGAASSDPPSADVRARDAAPAEPMPIADDGPLEVEMVRAPPDAAVDPATRDQMALFTPPAQAVAEIVRALDLDEMTPLAALNMLASLKQRLGG